MTIAALPLTVERANYGNPVHAAAIVAMLRAYAVDPMGGGEDLSGETQRNLVAGLKATSNAFSVLAFAGDEAAGLANCFWGFSTFAARPLVNIHDVVVSQQHRGAGIGRRLFAEIEAIARAENACKITLEVLEGNTSAKGLYASLGYGDYVLDPELGRAEFWQKRLTND
ncbi:GNAT family N-acetyltransferase [Sphingorhabdus sp. Alg239-R122]|uniref:GNAT family N-acetyltransferase n=1 Tax=Sphingorhabdus sp. Alg239-R122 TaxID=2305989 RepID=UPI0013DBF00E|nr:GNAT family N-acetyltransferase [Sphingorhabdus sp. Alg239-R122]